jgi:hypothetical protein
MLQEGIREKGYFVNTCVVVLFDYEYIVNFLLLIQCCLFEVVCAAVRRMTLPDFLV